MIIDPRGGCCTPLPYEAAVWLLEEEEELKGGQGQAATGEGMVRNRSSLFSPGSPNLMSGMMSFTKSVRVARGVLLDCCQLLLICICWLCHTCTSHQASPSPRTASLHPPPALSASYLASTGALKTMLAATINQSSPSEAPAPHEPVVRRVNDLGLRFIHQYPGEPAAGAIWGRILRARFLQDSRAPSAAPLRRKISTVRRFVLLVLLVLPLRARSRP